VFLPLKLFAPRGIARLGTLRGLPFSLGEVVLFNVSNASMMSPQNTTDYSMMKTIRFAFAVLLVSNFNICAIGNLLANADVTSPDGRNGIQLQTGEKGTTFEVRRDGRRLLGPSRLGCELVAGGGLGASAVLAGDVQTKVIDETFDLPWGKTKRVHNQANSVVVKLRESSGLVWEVELRAYNDGVAFRYRIVEHKGISDVAIRDETTAFDVVGQPSVLFNSLDSFTTSHESLYRRLPMSELPSGKLIDCPLLLDWPEGPAAAITEARVLNFAGCYLRRESPDQPRLNCRLSPNPNHPGASVVGPGALLSPWRVVLLADIAGDLLESNLLLCLNDPPAADCRWAVPGKTSFHWWNGEFEEDYLLDDGGDTFVARHKAYIDFCVASDISYHGLSGDGRAWYPQTSNSYGTPSADANVCVARPELRLPEILGYAKERGVGIRLWVHWEPLSKQLDEAFAMYERWGVKGLMVDFLNRDDQEMIEFTERMLTSAAKHHLHIQIHGSSKFSGEQRTFPHLFNREGVLNLENSKWSDRCDPQHSVNVAYTRALAGPVDYHSGGFRSVARADFQSRNLRPTVLGSRCHNMALFVVYENPMPMIADTPDAYEGEVGFDFLKQVPVTWDETRFMAGEPGEYVAVARRSGDVWYVGGINNWSVRTATLAFNFLDDGKWTLSLYHDESLDDSQPNTVAQQTRNIDKTDQLSLPMAPGGGFVGIVRRE